MVVAVIWQEKDDKINSRHDAGFQDSKINELQHWLFTGVYWEQPEKERRKDGWKKGRKGEKGGNEGDGEIKAGREILLGGLRKEKMIFREDTSLERCVSIHPGDKVIKAFWAIGTPGQDICIFCPIK